MFGKMSWFLKGQKSDKMKIMENLQNPKTVVYKTMCTTSGVNPFFKAIEIMEHQTQFSWERVVNKKFLDFRRNVF